MDLEISRLNLTMFWREIMSKNSVPKIRFKSFLNHWSYTELKEVKDVRDGTHSSPKYIDNGYPLVTSKNLSDSGLNLNDVSLISESDYNEINKRSKVEVGDILLGLIGTIGKPVLVETNGFAIKNVGLIKNGGQIQNQFLLQYLKTNLFNKYIQIEMAGNTQKFLGLETLRNTKIPVPSLAEQTAIGSLFRTLDDLLASYKDNLTNYQSLKVTMLSKMFPKAGQTVPEIRLDGFEGEWEVLQLSDICQKVTEKNKDNNFNETFTNSAEFGIISQRDFFEKDISNEKSLNTYYVVRNNDFVYNPRISNYAPVGPVKRNKLGRTGVMSPLYFVFRITNSNIDLDFLETFFNTNTWHKFMKLNGDSGARADRFAIKDSTFLTMPIAFPSLPEQQAIGAYFSNLDNLTNSYQEKITQLGTLKKKLLQDMFI